MAHDARPARAGWYEWDALGWLVWARGKWREFRVDRWHIVTPPATAHWRRPRKARHPSKA